MFEISRLTRRHDAIYHSTYTGKPPDEPAVLGMALNEFEGTVLLVSHDRSLLRAVCDEFWLVTKGGVEPFDGDLDDYQQFLRDEARRMREQAAGEQKLIA